MNLTNNRFHALQNYATSFTEEMIFQLLSISIKDMSLSIPASSYLCNTKQVSPFSTGV